MGLSIDREKVINEAFDEAITEVWHDDDYFDIGYNNGLEEGRRIALALLKDKEPVAPGLEQDGDGIYSTCGNCKTRLWKLLGLEFVINPDAMPKFCPQCGKEVKWK